MERRDAAPGAGVALMLTVVAMLTAVLVVTLAGCNPAISRRELVVVFDQSATPAQHASVLQTCAQAAPRTSPEPLGSSSTAAGRVNDVRFRVDHADDRDLNQLLQCLLKQPGVTGYRLPDASG